MDENMMTSTEQDQVVDTGFATVSPMDQVMRITPIRVAVTCREDTSQIPGANRRP
jgi:hypothetical protein